MRIAVLYATNFADISPGGILSVVRSLERSVPEGVQITHYGLGPSEASPLHTFIDVEAGRSPRRLPINVRFMLGLLRRRRELRSFDRVILHRAEHVVALPIGVRPIVVLHGASANGWRAKPGAFGILYFLIELLAVARSVRTYSVAWPDHSWMVRRFSARIEALRPPLGEYFRTDVQDRAAREELDGVIFVGRLAPEKRPQLAVEASARIPSVSVHFFGDGVLRQEVHDLAAKLSVPAVFHGHLPPDELARTLRTMAPHAVLMSTSTFEGYSVAVVEAAACGVPVVGLDTPGVGRAITACGGIVVAAATELHTAALQAHEQGNSRSPFNVAHDHDERSVGGSFWAGVVDGISQLGR